MKRLLCLILCMLLLSGCAGAGTAPEATGPDWSSLKKESSMALQYATQFSVDYYSEGYKLISIADGSRFVLVPEGAGVPKGLEGDMVVLKQPLDRIYLAATSAMDLYRAIDGIPNLRLSALEAKGWYISEAKAAMEAGNLLYAGKYSTPDYELIFSQGCDLAVESTMIYHSPSVKEQLERLGVPVLVERSSYEAHPLGRMEWMKLHAALLNRETLAQERFRQELAALEPVMTQPSTGKTVAFFAINSTGTVTVRKPGDYISKTITLAGGEYVFSDLGGEDNALSTMNMTMEAFYAGAKDADCLIYNSAITGELETTAQLLQQSPLLADFRAVQEGNIYCTSQNLFQESMGLGGLILDIHQALTQAAPGDANMHYLRQIAP